MKAHISTYNEPTISAGTVARTACLLLALTNQLLSALGFYAMLYTGLYFGETNLYMGGAALKKYDVWLAAYRSQKPTPDWPFGMWQYTSKGKIPGVSGDVDLSVAYKDYAKIIAKKGLDRLREGA